LLSSLACLANVVESPNVGHGPGDVQPVESLVYAGAANELFPEMEMGLINFYLFVFVYNN
jgi:hypothetical protein